jgi:hypothetical protein
MLPNLANWASVVGLIVGIAGLIYSILAFLEAGKAKKTAEGARQAVRALGASEKLHALSSRARELLNRIELDDFPVAAFLARDLRFEIDVAITRWEFLDSDTKSRFREASRVAMQIAEFTSSKGQLETKEKAKVLRKCDLILSVLGTESGRIQGGLESGSEP